MIEVKGLSKHYQNKAAVDNISFHIEEGQTMVLLGTSGCGKTTTLKMINRLIEPSSGHIYIGGEDVREQPAEQLRRNIGYVIQSIGLFPHYTVGQNIGLVPSLLGWKPTKIHERCDELMSLMGLSLALKERFPHELSGGQQQRVGLARALAADPQLILLDEPFGALDPITKQQIQKEFLTLDALKQKTMLMVSHDVFEAVSLGDTICLMDQGKIQQWGTPYELIFKPVNTFVHQFFNTQRFRLELQVVKLCDIIRMHDKDLVQENPSATAYVNMHIDSSLLEALEMMERGNAEYLFVNSSQQEQKRPSTLLSRENLMRYFYQFKKETR